MQHPPSRLSPPPGARDADIIDSAQLSQGQADDAKKNDPPKRGYRACVHCRLRKARYSASHCDVNAPSEPPCTRCRREQRNCVFLPSKRRKKHTPDHIDDADSGPGPSGYAQFQLPNIPSIPPSVPIAQTQPQPHQIPHIALDPLLPDARLGFGFYDPDVKPMLFDVPSNPTPKSVDSTSTSALSPVSRAKRKQPDATRRIVVASFASETDALEILAHAATDEDDPKAKNPTKGQSLSDYVLIKSKILDEGTLWGLTRYYFDHHHPVLPIVQTPRIPRTPLQLPKFANEEPFLLAVIVAISSRYHADQRIQRIHAETWSLIRQVLADYTLAGTQANMGLVEGALLLAEFLPREIGPSDEQKAKTFSLLGPPGKSASPTTGSNPVPAGGLHGSDNRRSWAMTGLAIRAAYGLQLDEAALVVEGERTPEQERARLDWTWCYLYDRTIGLRTGLAFWSRGPTLCFTGYSHISQTGEAAARLHFPSMLSPTPAETYGGKSALPKEGNTIEDAQIRGAGADSASLIQALTELTQLMTNAHDTLYPNRMRTSDLVRKGAYFRHLDSYSRALDAFKVSWQNRVWQSDQLRELTWCTYEMVRLYVSSFAFQAHVQRAWARVEEEEERTIPSLPGLGNSGIQLFPRGSATSPDALYIYASIDAANEILNICIRLGNMGVLGVLPSRYLINFVFGGVFALKAGYSGAVSKAEIAKTRELVDKVSTALVLASQDREHPACRYGQMLRLLCRKLEELSDQSASRPQGFSNLGSDLQAVPSRFPSPEPLSTLHMPQATGWEQLLLSTGQGLGSGQGSSQNPFSNPLDMPPMPTSQEYNNTNLFDFDVDVNFNMDGFWDDFTLADSGLPFR